MAVEPLLLERLGLQLGDTIEIGSSLFTLGSVIEHEPDKVGDNVGFGPRVLMSLDSLEKNRPDSAWFAIALSL